MRKTLAIASLALLGAVALPLNASAQRADSTAPSVHITSATASGKCITVKVNVSHFRLVKPVYVAPIPTLKGMQGHIHYTLNGKILPTRDATTKQSHTFCGASQFVKKGMNTVTVYLATATHTPFPGAMKSTKQVMVK